MLIKHCSSFPVVMVALTIGLIEQERGAPNIITGSTEAETFSFTTSRKIAQKLNQRDKIVLICVPEADLRSARQVLFLGRKEKVSTEVFIGQGTMWHDMYLDNFPKLT